MLWWQLPLIPEPQVNYKVFEGRDLKKYPTLVFRVILDRKQIIIIIIIIIAELIQCLFCVRHWLNIMWTNSFSF